MLKQLQVNKKHQNQSSILETVNGINTERILILQEFATTFAAQFACNIFNDSLQASGMEVFKTVMIISCISVLYFASSMAHAMQDVSIQKSLCK